PQYYPILHHPFFNRLSDICHEHKKKHPELWVYFLVAAVFLVSLFARAGELTNIWSLRAGIGSESSPALSTNGILYFGSWDHRLYAVSTNRFIKWAFTTGLDIKSSPAIGDD